MKKETKRPEIPDDHPMIFALRSGDATTVKQYLEEGISPYTVGLISGALGSGCVEIVQAFLDHGLELSRPINIHGETPIFRTIEKKQMAILELLVQKGADVHDRPMGGGTVLHKASALWPAGAAFLLSVGADVNARASEGRTPMMGAAFGNQTESLELLLAAGGKLEDCDKEGTTALILASRAGKAEAVKWLLDHGANIRATDNAGKTAENWARENGHPQIVEMLQSRMAL